MNILIMDSGLYSSHSLFENEKLDGYALTYDDDSGICKRVDDFTDTIGHGTAIYHLIRKNCPHANIKVVKIFDNELSISEEAFYQALLYINENENPDILNLSLGITHCNDIEKLYDVCKNLHNKGVKIFSAFDNGGALSYPAAFDCVYGIEGIKEIKKVNEIWNVKNSYVNICAKGTIGRVAWRNPDYTFISGNSFSCGMAASAIASEISKDNITHDDSNLDLYIDSEKFHEKRKPSFNIKQAAIFPFNKEIHSIARFSELLTFNIKELYDHKSSGRVGASVRQLLGTTDVVDRKIKNIDVIEWKNIDTLIIGHMVELMQLTNDYEMRNRLLHLANKHHINVYSFDDIQKRDENIYHPIIDKNHLPTNHFGKLFKINKPVLGVCGTSSQQGKFTLQLILRNKLIKRGYDVGQLGTEPSAFLFGFDEVFPYGYGSSIYLNEQESIIYVNRLMNNISIKKCDLIIVGSQSAAVSYELNNVCQFTPHQQSFLYATSPDAIILMVSPQNDITYIKRTISYIEGVTQGIVLAICLFPKRLKGSNLGTNISHELLPADELCEHKRRLEKEINIKAFILGDDEEMNKLVDKVIDYF